MQITKPNTIWQIYEATIKNRARFTCRTTMEEKSIYLNRYQSRLLAHFNWGWGIQIPASTTFRYLTRFELVLSTMTLTRSPARGMFPRSTNCRIAISLGLSLT